MAAEWLQGESMHIVVVGLNHRSAPIELRERLAFRREQLPGAFAALRREIGLEESAILSTCNRVEIYAAVPTLDGAVGRLQQFFSRHARIAPPELAGRLYDLAEPHSVRHLFSVASGLDSMVLGEAEILRQVKHAYEAAQEFGAAGKLFHGLFQRALNTAKAVRTGTAIGRGCCSIGTVAVELAEKIFGRLAGARVLLIGAGKVGELTLKQLASRGVGEIRVMNRTADRAEALAAAYRAASVGLDRLAQELLDADIVISSTATPAPLLGKEVAAAAMRARHQRPLCIVDLGVPRNIDPDAASLENLYLFNVDDLQGIVERSQHMRQAAMGEALAIVDRKVERFVGWWSQEVAACVPSCSGLAEAP
jgi:glutamyl-tRNA reductase